MYISKNHASHLKIYEYNDIKRNKRRNLNCFSQRKLSVLYSDSRKKRIELILTSIFPHIVKLVALKKAYISARMELNVDQTESKATFKKTKNIVKA